MASTGMTRFLLNFAESENASMVTDSHPAESGFPYTNLVNPDRYRVWSYPYTLPMVQRTIIVDLGQSRVVDVFGWMGLGGIGGPTSVVVQASNSNPPTGGAPYSFFTARDACVVLNAPLSARYVSYRFIAPGPFTLGKVLAGKVVDVSGAVSGTGLGIVYSPGSTDALVRARVRNSTVTGVPYVTEVGLPRRRMGLKFSSVTESIRAAVEDAVARAPFAMVDARGRLFEVDVPSDTFEAVHLWGPPDLYDIEVEVESLP